MWTCLEVILWEQFQSLLSGYQQSRLEHQTRISSGSPFWLANTKHESIAVAQSRRSCEALPNWHGSIEAARISCNTMRSSLVSYSLQSNAKQRSVKTSKASSHMSASAKHPLPASRKKKKTLNDTTESPKKQEISTSLRHVHRPI